MWLISLFNTQRPAMHRLNQDSLPITAYMTCKYGKQTFLIQTIPNLRDNLPTTLASLMLLHQLPCFMAHRPNTASAPARLYQQTIFHHYMPCAEKWCQKRVTGEIGKGSGRRADGASGKSASCRVEHVPREVVGCRWGCETT